MDTFNRDHDCPKCGGSDVGTAHHQKMHFRDACSWGSISTSREEHMHRTCRRCCYDWLETPLDVAERAIG